MAHLRDGTEVDDPRLDRLVDFDERSRQFPVRALIAEDKPARSYTWNFAPRDRAPLDQGPDGACVGFAWTHELQAKPAVLGGLGKQFAYESVYLEAQKIDPWEGGEYPGASPRYSGTSVLAGAKVLHRKGYLDEYRWAFGRDDLVMAVGHQGPAIVGTNWYSGMSTPDEDDYARPTGSVLGGHAYLCLSVDFDDGFFRCVNSWGPNWGGIDDWVNWRDTTINRLPGWFKIAFEDMDTLLADRGEACIPVVRRRGV